jgi:hypothetical protein
VAQEAWPARRRQRGPAVCYPGARPLRGGGGTVDTVDLKSTSVRAECGFESRPPYLLRPHDSHIPAPPGAPLQVRTTGSKSPTSAKLSAKRLSYPFQARVAESNRLSGPRIVAMLAGAPCSAHPIVVTPTTDSVAGSTSVSSLRQRYARNRGSGRLCTYSTRSAMRTIPHYSLPEQRASHLVGRRLLHVGQDVRVDVERDRH